MSKIIKIEPVEQRFSITWNLGSFCNYDCMYCPTEYHDKTSKPHDFETLQKAWDSIRQKTENKNLKYKITFAGGEVSANKSFLPFVKFLKENFVDVKELLVVTNGSASYQYYAKLSELVTSITFSTHSEFIDEKKFFEKCRRLNLAMFKNKKMFHVAIMNEYWNQDRIIDYVKFCSDNHISYSINEIDYSYANRKDIMFNGVYNLNEIKKSKKL